MNRPRPTTQTTGTRITGLKNLDKNNEGTIREQNGNKKICRPRLQSKLVKIQGIACPKNMNRIN